MNRPLGVLIGIGLIIMIALGAVASRVGSDPPESSADALPAGRITDQVRQTGRSAFAQESRTSPGFADSSVVPVRSTTPGSGPATHRSMPDAADSTDSSDSVNTITGDGRRQRPTPTRPTPLGANRTAAAQTTTGSIPDRNARRENAARNANLARQNAAQRIQQAGADGIARSLPLAADIGSRAPDLGGAPAAAESNEPRIGMSQEMHDRLLAELMAGVGRNTNRSGSTATGSGSTRGGSGSNSDSGITNSTGNGSGGRNTGGTTTPIDTTPIVGGITGPNAVDTSGNLSASFRWVPIATPTGCSNTSTARIADLYVRVNTPAPIAAVESGGTTVLRTSNGAFIQSSTGTDLPPTSTDPCAAIDSFLDLGGRNPTVLPTGSTPVFGTGASAAITAGWVSLSGIIPSASPTRYGDSQYYLRVARIAVPAGASVSGSLTVGFLATSTTPAATLAVTVPNCTECWGSTTQPPPTGGTDDVDDEDPDDGDTGSGDDDDDEDPDDGSGGNDGGTDGGNGGTDGGNGGTDGGNGGTDGGNGGNDGGTDNPNENVFDLVWLPITNTCTDLTLDAGNLNSYKTYDLFIRMGLPHQILAVDATGSSTGLKVNGTVFQYPDEGAGIATNFPPLNRYVKTNPCLAFDSYFDANGALAGFFFEPDPMLWPATMRTLWFPTLGTASRGTTNTAFGGPLFYYRIMRVTVAAGGSVSGTIVASGRKYDGTQSINVELTLPALP